MRRRIAGTITTLRRLGPLAPAAVLAVVLPVIGVAVLAAPLIGVAPAVRDAGLVGAAAFAIGAGALAGLSIIPMHLLAMLAGWTFSIGAGVPIVFAGLVAASVIGYAGSAALAGDRVPRLLREHAGSAAVHAALVDRGTGRAAFIVGLLRLSPVMPFAATNLVMAAAQVPFRAFMMGTVAGMLPRVVAGVMVGAGLTRIDPRAPADSWPAMVGIVATLLALGVIGRIARRALHSVEQPAATSLRRECSGS